MVRGIPFRKGQSGNPKGRQKGVPNKATKEIRELARALFDEAYWKRVKARIDSGDLPPALEQTFLAYGYGKPKETVEVSGPDGAPIESVVQFYVPENARRR
jgi:hypothetical protein